MRMRAHLVFLLALLALPNILLAQGFGIGARIGTLGLGVEAALGLSQNFVARGGIGSYFLDFEGESDGVEYTISPPSMAGTLGIDLYPMGGAFRLMAGMMFRDGDIDLQSGDLAAGGTIEIGDTEYDEAGTLQGSLASKSAAPFIGLGFGHHTQGGFGFFLDLGVAFVGDPEVTLTAEGPIATEPGIQDDLAQEAENIEDDWSQYLKYWPIFSLGVKIPFK